MQNKLRLKIDSIINLECCRAYIEYGGILVIGFGELVEYEHPKLKNSFHGQWEIRTNVASWRLLNDNKIIAGDYDDDSAIKTEILSLIGAKLKSITLQTLNVDAKFEFDNNIVCEIFGISRKDYSWQLLGPNINIEAQPDNKLVMIESDFVGSLDPDEEKILIHSEACSKRWINIIPEKNHEKYCSDCIYYRALEGQFHFFDYGLCTNAQSSYDGKVVNVGSGCKVYGTEL
ncbi:MAG: DUF3027 domain-containing protein [Desulfobacterales bacterium]|nr:DUF3027 domain-containing protein [Desulfobacterales bacterium]MCP4161055.1 DUF3027 domain-containing protein [Deltaproteobacteria bacterium]